MSSTKENGAAAAAAQQLGSMSLGETAERKGEPETKNEDDTNGTPTKLCSKCGKESDTLKKCRDCKCVSYCDKDCQNRHWKEHKKECKPIKKELAKRDLMFGKREGKLDLGSELDLGPLPDLPPREVCPICLQVLPLHENLQVYSACCGKMICGGCDLQHNVKSEGSRSCAFCRVPIPTSDKATLAQYRKIVKRNDPLAICNLGIYHGNGDYGLPVDHAKCFSLVRQSAGLGCAVAQYQIGIYYHTGAMGLEQNKEEAIKWWKKAAEGGHFQALRNVGTIEYINGNHVAAMRHWCFTASGGKRSSMDALIECFRHGQLHHSDLAETLQAMYRARDELKSEDRDKYIVYLKMTGEYTADLEL